MDHTPLVISMLATFAKEKNGYPSTSEKGEKREEKVPPPKKKKKK